MMNPITWVVSRINNMMFYRAFNHAPVKRLGNLYVKEVMGNFYVVELEEIPPNVEHVRHLEVLE